MKYRSKVVEIDAVRFTGENAPAIVEWAKNLGAEGKTIFPNTEGTKLMVKTPSGEVLAKPGDFIISQNAEDFYPCKSDVFEKKYEAV